MLNKFVGYFVICYEATRWLCTVLHSAELKQLFSLNNCWKENLNVCKVSHVLGITKQLSVDHIRIHQHTPDHKWPTLTTNCQLHQQEQSYDYAGSKQGYKKLNSYTGFPCLLESQKSWIFFSWKFQDLESPEEYPWKSCIFLVIHSMYIDKVIPADVYGNHCLSFGRFRMDMQLHTGNRFGRYYSHSVYKKA